MKLFSHGPGSNLLEHLNEVVRGAEDCLPERIIFACHDIGKATKDWQNYISGRQNTSPHFHATAGGILAAALIHVHFRGKAQKEFLMALHTGAAHHDALRSVALFSEEVAVIFRDEQAKMFFLDRNDGIHGILSEIAAEEMQKAWSMAAACNHPRQELQHANMALEQMLSGRDRLEVYLAARDLLGRLCAMDHASAAKQSGEKAVMPNSCQERFSRSEFKIRTAKQFSGNPSKLMQLRTSLRENFLSVIDRKSFFYFIDAPTGLGKTEAMLQGAEKLLKTGDGLKKIVFAVPQISIADQIFAEYFPAGDDAQIWNYLRQEHKNVPASPPESSNNDPAFELELVRSPFAASYNITTFNQVLLAMCHPNRMRCIRGLALRNAVVVMDEFHKLPLCVMPGFFRFARLYAEKFNCRFVCGSATPLSPGPYLDDGDAACMSSNIEAIYRAPEIDNRRKYVYAGPKNVEDIAAMIERFEREHPTESLLVVLNLVGKGSWQILKKISPYNPWRQLDGLREVRQAPCCGMRRTAVLDGMVPPGLRRDLVTICKEAMKTGPVTLISTQMIEVGVDLDFNHALIDYQGLAATIQRGGRVGREGNGNTAATVEVFSLMTENGASSHEILLDIMEKSLNDLPRAFKSAVQDIQKCNRREQDFFTHEMSTRAGWRDWDLTEKIREIYDSGTPLDADDLWALLFPFAQAAGSLGVEFQNAQYLSELFSSDYQKAAVVVRNAYDAGKLMALQDLIESGRADELQKREFMEQIANHTIRINDDILTETGIYYYKKLTLPEDIPLYFVEAPIL